MPPACPFNAVPPTCGLPSAQACTAASKAPCQRPVQDRASTFPTATTAIAQRQPVAHSLNPGDADRRLQGSLMHRHRSDQRPPAPSASTSRPPAHLPSLRGAGTAVQTANSPALLPSARRAASQPASRPPPHVPGSRCPDTTFLPSPTIASPAPRLFEPMPRVFRHKQRPPRDAHYDPKDSKGRLCGTYRRAAHQMLQPQPVLHIPTLGTSKTSAGISVTSP